MNVILSHLTRLVKATGYSCEGLLAAFKSEPAFALEVVLCLFLIPTALVLDLRPFIKTLLISSLLLVLIVELINSAIEAAIDRISLDKHPLSKKAKDIGSAAVFLSIINAIALWTAALI
jgi:diacylglycerol kinase (ATP)